MDINLDKASKFYEPGEKVTGYINLRDMKAADVKDKLNLQALSYMDTVSQIRGDAGRPPLEESQKTYFMKKSVAITEVANRAKMLKFEFILESTEAGEKLLDAYVGVEFSIIVSRLL